MVEDTKQKAEIHRQNVTNTMAASSSPEQRLGDLLNGTIAAIKAIQRDMNTKVDAELAFMHDNVKNMVDAVFHGVKR